MFLAHKTHVSYRIIHNLLILNDYRMTEYVSSYLYLVSEDTIRVVSVVILMIRLVIMKWNTI